MTGCGCGGAKCRLAAGDDRHGRAVGYRQGCRCAKCRGANTESARRRRLRNPEGARKASAKWRRENPDKARAAVKSYRRTHREEQRKTNAKWRAANKERARAYAARYRADNPHVEREWLQTAEGRASKRAAGRRRRERERLRYCGCDTPANLHAVWLLDGGLCAYCGAEGTDYEHVVPLARGGWGCVSNFRVACGSCNSRKGTQPLSVFLERLAASGTPVRPGATNSGLLCPAAAERMARLSLTA